MDIVQVALAPVRIPLRLARALDDLTALADRARRDPDPVDVGLAKLDTALAELTTLTDVARALTRVAAEIVDGGADLTATATILSEQTQELIEGGRDLTETAKLIEDRLAVFQAALPRLLAGLDTVEELETAVETVAETVEPLQGAAERVGRVTERFGRSRR